METKNKSKKIDPVIHVSPKRYEKISRIAGRTGISRKDVAEGMFKKSEARA